MNTELIIYIAPAILFIISLVLIIFLKRKHLKYQSDWANHQDKNIEFNFDSTTAIIISAILSLVIFLFSIFTYVPIEYKQSECYKELKSTKVELKGVKDDLKDLSRRHNGGN